MLLSFLSEALDQSSVPLVLAGTPVLFVVEYAVVTLFAVGCHRILLVPGESVATVIRSGWKKRHWKFLWLSIIFAVAMALILLSFLFVVFIIETLFVVLIGTLIGGAVADDFGLFEHFTDTTLFLIPVLTFCAAYVMATWALRFPVTALDHPIEDDQLDRLAVGHRLNHALALSISQFLLPAVPVTGDLLGSVIGSEAIYAVLAAEAAHFWLICLSVGLGVSVLSSYYDLLVRHADLPINGSPETA